MMLRDYKNTFGNLSVAWIFAWYDIKLRYRRTRLGLIWITLSVLIESLILSLLFGSLFKQNFLSFYPYVFSGRVVWQLISGIFSDALVVIPQSKNYILNHNIPPHVFVTRICTRNLLIFLHSSLFVYIFCAINYTSAWQFLSLFLIPIFAVAITLAVYPFALILSILGARYRDIVFLIPYCLQILFYATPIVWKQSDLTGTLAYYLMLNPVTPMLETVRNIFLGQAISYSSIAVTALIGISGWMMAVCVYQRAKAHLCYWML